VVISVKNRPNDFLADSSETKDFHIVLEEKKDKW